MYWYSISITGLALGWLEYCNGTRDTYYANLRRVNGHPEPYNVSTSSSVGVALLQTSLSITIRSVTEISHSQVKYWALGNEMWGEWQVNQMTPEQYAQQALSWAKGT